MNIIPELNLNRTPAGVKNNSAFFAKNVKLSKDNQYYERDDLYQSILQTVGTTNVIYTLSTNDCILLFTQNSKIYKFDGANLTQITANWHYNGGTLQVTYTYNSLGELIIAIAESGDNIDIPLKIINLSKSTNSDSEDSYTIAPNVPICNCNLVEYVKGIQIPNGIYHFYIRYEISKDVYSKWFPIGIPYYALNVKTKNIINHSYKDKTGDIQKSDITIIVNEDIDSSHSFNLSLEFINSKVCNYQIGYILQHENSVVGRLWREFNIPNTTTTQQNLIFDAKYLSEVNIDDFAESVFNLTNVKTLTNYNNRLYVANYKESNYNEEIDSSIINNIKVRFSVKKLNGQLNTIYNSLDSIDYNIAEDRCFKPNGVYNFFIHFVRSDGSYTNGYKLNNDNLNSWNNYSVLTLLKDCDNLSTDYIGLNALKSNDNFKNKPLYNFVNNYTFNLGSISNCKLGYCRNINGDVLFKMPPLIEIPLLGYYPAYPIFLDVTIPDGFVGWFVSYEEVENNIIYEGAVTDIKTTVTGNNLYLKISNTESFVNNKLNGFNFVKFVTDKGNILEDDIFLVDKIKNISSNIIDNENSAWSTPGTHVQNPYGAYSTYGEEQAIIFKWPYNIVTNIDSLHDTTTESQNKDNFIVDLCILPENLYLNKNKKLIKYTTIYSTNTPDYTKKEDYNLPSFLTRDNILYYKTPIEISSVSEVNKNYSNYVIDVEDKVHPDLFNGDNYIKNALIYRVSDYNTEAFTIFKESTPVNGVKIITVTVEEEEQNINVPINYYTIEPKNVVDAFELKSHFIIDNFKLYSNYNADNTINIFPRGIRRSDVIRDESAENSWLYFRANNYKLINENKGQINNLVGIGLILLAHTEQSMFIFDRNASLKTSDKNVMLSIPDTFDVDYQELLPTNSYGGISDNLSWIVGEFGYIWYDKITNNIFVYDSNSIKSMSPSIQKYLDEQYNNINSIKFVFDRENSRIFIGLCDSVAATKVLSFNVKTNTFISIHDIIYYFGNLLKNKLYFVNKIANYTNTIYKIGGTANGLRNENTDFPIYKASNGQCHSYIDIIFNDNYMISKIINSIKYTVKELDDNYTQDYNVIEDKINKNYCGNQILIYTDSCKSDLLNISNGYPQGENKRNNINKEGLIEPYPTVTPVTNRVKLNSYKLPYYENGVWNFNYFRNILNSTGDTDIPDFDNKSLIYGKYIVVRFIFNYNFKFKFDNIVFNVESNRI